MFFNQLHNKIVPTWRATVPGCVRSPLLATSSPLVHSWIKTFSVALQRQSWTLTIQFPILQSQIKYFTIQVCFFHKRWDSVEKIPWGRNILLGFFLFVFVVIFQMKKKPRQTLAGSFSRLLLFLLMIGTGSQGTRRHRSLWAGLCRTHSLHR